jgi:hypothetical protein
MSDQVPNEKKMKHRSPNYPAVSLKRAVEMVKGLYETDRRQKVPMNIVAKRWGYKEDSSASQQAVAALSAYGLLDVEGVGTLRKVSVSEDAYKYLLSRPEVQKDLVVKFALSPGINLKVWEHYGHELPQDDVLKEYLLFELKFNPETVGLFISRLRETVAFAGLANGDYTDNASDESDDSREESMEVTQQLPPKRPEGIPLQSISTEHPFSSGGPVRENQRELRFQVASGDITMRIPAAMNALDFEILQIYLQGLAKALPKVQEPDGQGN